MAEYPEDLWAWFDQELIYAQENGLAIAVVMCGISDLCIVEKKDGKFAMKGIINGTAYIGTLESPDAEAVGRIIGREFAVSTKENERTDK